MYMKPTIKHIPRLRLDDFVTHIAGKSFLDPLSFPLGQNGYYTEKMAVFSSNYKRLPTSYMQDFYKIYWLEKGNMVNISQTGKTHHQDWKIFISKPGETKRWCSVKDTEGYFIAFSRNYLSNLQYRKNMLLEFPYLLPYWNVQFNLDTWHHTQIGQLFRRIYYEFSHKKKQSCNLIRLWTQELLILLKRCSSGENVNIDAQQPAALVSQQFVEKLEEHFMEGFSQNLVTAKGVRDFAQELCTTPNHLNYQLKKHIGKSAKTMIIERYILAAQCKLIHTDLSVSEICYLLGFENPSYFSRYFKKYANVSPQAYRDRFYKMS